FGVLALLAMLLGQSESAVGTPTCTINWNNTAGGNFTTAANWNDAVTPTTHRVPGSTDVACISVSTTGLVSLTTGKTIKALDADAPGGSSSSGGTLTLSDGPSASTINALSLSGTIAGASPLTLTGASTWSSATIQGTGSLTIGSSATVTIPDCVGS